MLCIVTCLEYKIHSGKQLQLILAQRLNTNEKCLKFEEEQIISTVSYDLFSYFSPWMGHPRVLKFLCSEVSSYS